MVYFLQQRYSRKYPLKIIQILCEKRRKRTQEVNILRKKTENVNKTKCLLLKSKYLLVKRFHLTKVNRFVYFTVVIFFFQEMVNRSRYGINHFLNNKAHFIQNLNFTLELVCTKDKGRFNSDLMYFICFYGFNKK